ncbi:MAG: sulfurtransferase complex subunit TusB [archaeon]
MKSYLVIVSSSPSSVQAARGLQTALDLQSKGEVSVMLIQDAVLDALKRSRLSERLMQLTSRGTSIYVLAEHLYKRGFLADDLLENVKIADYTQLVELMMNEETMTTGVF